MNTVNVKFYQILKNDFHLSDEKSKEFAQVINEVISGTPTITDFKSAVKEDFLRLELKLVTEIKTINRSFKMVYWTVYSTCVDDYRALFKKIKSLKILPEYPNDLSTQKHGHSN